MDPQIIVLIGVCSTLVGIVGGRYSIRRGQREELDADVKASDKIREYFQAIAAACADGRIDVARDRHKWLDGRDGDTIKERFDRVDEQLASLQESVNNGLASRIAAQVTTSLRENVGSDAPRLHVRKSRRKQP